jgi:hypothetical protein
VVGSEGGKPTPIRIDGVPVGRQIAFSPDGDRLAYLTKEGQTKQIRIRIAPFTGGGEITVPGAPLEENDNVIQWSADGRFLYIARELDIPAVVDRLELSTGKREAWKSLAPADPAGVMNVGSVHVSRDGQSYAYSYVQQLTSNLYIVDGVK